MEPPNAFKISDDFYLSSNMKIRYKQTLIKRFEFLSKHQSMSVICQNELDKSYRYFIKGAPEKIIFICKENTLPSNFDKTLTDYTKVL